jgi:ABC-type branched-subunit amino acid transport system ATPase component
MSTTASNTPLVEVNNLEVVYGGAILAVNGVSIVVPQGGFVSVLGANGAGKTSFVPLPATSASSAVPSPRVKSSTTVSRSRSRHRATS